MPYLSALELEVCSRRGAIQIHVYLTLPYLRIANNGNDRRKRLCSNMGSALNDDDDDDICLCIWLTWFDRPTLSHSLDHQASRYAFSVKLTHTFASSFYFFRCFQEFNASVNIYATCETRRGKECFASCITSLLPSSS